MHCSSSSDFWLFSVQLRLTYWLTNLHLLAFSDEALWWPWYFGWQELDNLHGYRHICLSWPYRRGIPVWLEVRKQPPSASGSYFHYGSFHYAFDPGEDLLWCIRLCHLFQFSGWIDDYFYDSWNPKSRKGRWKGFRRWIADAVFRNFCLDRSTFVG